MKRTGSDSEDRVVTTSCYYDCGGRCLLLVHVKNGEIVKIETDKGGTPGLKACAKGLAGRDVVYSEHRLRKPLKRVGERGSGKFEPIAWDEALGRVARELQRVKDRYGANSIFLVDSLGSMSPLHGTRTVGRRFFALFGGYTARSGNMSFGGAAFSSLMTFGTEYTGNTPDNFLHSRLIILWGWNPVATRFGPDTVHYLAKARRAGAKIVSVDPRYSLSARSFAEQWIPIKPGTDTALLIAMAYVMIDENLYDRPFIETYTVGFDKFRDHVLGREDGIAKTPLWAEGITGVPAEAIAQLARDYATIKPAALYTGWAPGRSAFGEQYHRVASVLATMTGNIGVVGGIAAGGTHRIPLGRLGATLPVPAIRVPAVHVSELYQALLKGRSGGYHSDIKLLYIVGCNMLNQFPNANKGVLALQQPEFTVIHELFLTPTARFADIILPVTTVFERPDIGQPWLGGDYFIHMEQAIEPVPETRSDLAIFSELARRLGIPEYDDRSDQDWLKEFAAATRDIPSYGLLRRRGLHRIPRDGPLISFREQIEDPSRHPFSTPSGKIEIYSQKMAEMQNPLIPPIPKYIEGWGGVADPDRNKYPIQLVSPRSRGRVNSQLHDIARLKSLADDCVWLHPSDAHQRGIANDDWVRIFNQRGQLVVKVRVTEHILPGVASLESGLWFAPNARGIDQGGCVNVLTEDRASPGGAFTCNSCLVQIERYDG